MLLDAEPLMMALTVTDIFAVAVPAAAVTGAVTGLFFRGAASAWKTERDAAVERADRLDAKVAEQAEEIVLLKSKVADLEKRTDYEAFADRSAAEHRRILDSLGELTRGLHANTVATEFLIKQAFPAAHLAFGHDPAPEGRTG